VNVLITSASRKVGLVRAFQEALAAEGGGSVVAVDTNPLSAALYVAERRHLVPASVRPEFVEVLLGICRREQVRLLVPTRDEELPVFAASREAFAEADVFVAVPALEVVRTCQDKERFLAACAAAGLSVPERIDPAAPRFPLFVKPRFGKGSRFTFRADDPGGLAFALARVPEPIVQEFVDVPEYTVDLFADLNGRVLSVVPRQRVVVLGGESFVGRTVKSPPVIAAAIRLAEALGLAGHNTIQCFFDGERVLFIEVNPRYGGAAHLSFAAGAPTPRFLVRLLEGRSVERSVDDFRDGLVMLRYTQDLYLEPGQLAGGGAP